jgi:AraC-like DNA-binding protein
VFETSGVRVDDFRCTAQAPGDGPEEPNPTHSIVLVRRGVFRRMHRGETLVADAGHVVFFNASEPYRYAHPVPGGDDCLILAVETRQALELVARHAPRDAQRPEAPFRLGHGLATNRAAWLQHELIARAARQDDPLALEDVTWELADEAVRAAYRAHPGRADRETPSTAAVRRRRELAEAAKLVVNDRLGSPLRLDEIARQLGCSPFHLSRTFRRVVGVSLRRYVLRLRSRVAGERLAQGAADLTRLAFELGFADHSHFTNVFRGEWGTAPSRFRTRVRR